MFSGGCVDHTIRADSARGPKKRSGRRRDDAKCRPRASARGPAEFGKVWGRSLLLPTILSRDPAEALWGVHPMRVASLRPVRVAEHPSVSPCRMRKIFCNKIADGFSCRALCFNLGYHWHGSENCDRLVGNKIHFRRLTVMPVSRLAPSPILTVRHVIGKPRE